MADPFVKPKIVVENPGEWDATGNTKNANIPGSPYGPLPVKKRSAFATGCLALLTIPGVGLICCGGATLQRWYQSRQTHEGINANSNRPVATPKDTPVGMPTQTPDGTWQVPTPTPLPGPDVQATPYIEPGTIPNGAPFIPAQVYNHKPPVMSGDMDTLANNFFDPEERQVMQMLIFRKEYEPKIKVGDFSFDLRVKNSIVAMTRANEANYARSDLVEAVSDLAIAKLTAQPITKDAYNRLADKLAVTISPSSREVLKYQVTEFQKSGDATNLEKAMKEVKNVELIRSQEARANAGVSLTPQGLDDRHAMDDAKVSLGLGRVVEQLLSPAPARSK